ncbi:MAG: protein kinase [Planctomyces sp.]|nr:protein kinase [Planctomyces sp.]
MKFTFAPETRPLDGYTIKRAIHRGGFGEVYYALSDAGKEVALKLLNNNLDVELRGVSQCLNLKHPNLVTIFDIRQDSDKDHWIVMEYVGGRGLYDVMQDHPAGMPIRELLFWLSGMAAGLSFLHDRGIVHRDLKPANVFSDDGVVKIGDVGLSKYISESRRSAQTQSVGTVYYMAPEVARGRYGREVDIYAMGVMLYEMLTGRVPFDGETTAEILMKHLTAEPDLTVLPVELRSVIAAALEKDPTKRIGDVDELERRFREAAGGMTGAVVDAAPQRKPEPVRTAPRAAAPAPRGAAPAPHPLKASLERGRDARERSLAGVKGSWQPLSQFWNDRVPTPIKWILGGTAFIMILELGAIRSVGAGAVVGGFAFVAWKAWCRLFGAPGTGIETPADSDFIPAVPRPAVHPVSPNPHGRPQAVYQPPRPAAVVVPPSYTPATARQIPRGQRASDLVSSLVMAMFAVALVTTAIHFATGILPETATVVYFGTVTLIAAWSLIIPAKLWEGNAGDTVIRRITQGGLGIGVGGAAWLLSNFLMLSENSLLRSQSGHPDMVLQLGKLQISDANGTPTMAGFMLFFGLLFLSRRWWWQIDSFRKSRFRISSTLVTFVLGAILTAIISFPESLGTTWALAISAVVQLSAGWTPKEDRYLEPAPASSQAAPVLAQVKHPVVAAPPAPMTHA